MAYRICAFILGLIIAAYWARVMRMARKARRKTGRAANLLPAESLGRALRIVWVPIVIVWIVQPFLTGIGRPSWGMLRPVWHSTWMAWLGVLIAGACFWASRVCWRTMGRNWRMGIDPTERTALVLEGPYERVRHPIYALSQAMMLASVVVVPSPLMLAAGLGHILLLQWEARREEAYLRTLHGPEYEAYCARVGRFVPAIASVRAADPHAAPRGGPQNV